MVVIYEDVVSTCKCGSDDLILICTDSYTYACHHCSRTYSEDYLIEIAKIQKEDAEKENARKTKKKT